MTELRGWYDPAFEPLATAFLAMFTDDPGPDANDLPEVGAAVSVVIEGTKVVDLWAGTLSDRRTPWQRDTLVPVLSCTKGIVAIVFHRLAEAGLVDVNAPVATYWPEYAAAGKGDTLVRHLLTHSAGQPTVTTDLGPGGIWDWDRVVAAFAAAPTIYPVGTAVGYHTLSFGHLVGEVIRRVSGRSVGALIADLSTELADEIGADFHLGITDPTVLARCDGLTEPPTHSPNSPGAIAAHEVDFARVSRYDDLSVIHPAGLASPQWRAAGYPGAGAFTNARALAAIYGALANDRLLSPSYRDAVSAEFTSGLDLTLGSYQSFALGWQRCLPDRANRPTTGFGHSGAWGSIGWCDPNLGIGFGYTMNRANAFGGDQRAAALWRATLPCL
jgi:CubicO group peptidase (beta-lactamase class C family)